ncbi:hypothetical protein [Microcoleus sp. FACHB-672]|uniref:hypothetical protein n=1 Tax=Microcoleus sp. FACHB-672 TaxID=2692825 RepID=UPI001687A63E|nr:hypothetical protein [Microcoleus sp. FACHB-672]MBD2041939.1 hypothetical protein [Microcoleus sp. FACHB-672]
MALRSLQETATHHSCLFLPRRLSAFTLLGLIVAYFAPAGYWVADASIPPIN